MNNTDIAYLAGLIDGDGSISIQVRSKTKAGGPKWGPTVTISNTCLMVLEWCKKMTGSGFISKKKVYKKHHTQSYVLRWDYNSAIDIATKCHQYLIIKKKRSECLMQWKSLTPRNGKYNEETWQKKMDLIKESRRLNKDKE